MSVQISGAEEGDNVTRGGEITFQCSVEDVPGVVTLDWYLGAEHLQTHELKTMEGRLVDRYTLDTADLDLGETVILCRPDLVTAGFNNNDMAASVRINLVGEDIEYDSNEVEDYREYASSEEEHDESYEDVTDIVASNVNDTPVSLDTEEATSWSPIEISNEYNYDDEEDAVRGILQPEDSINDQRESQYKYGGDTAADYYDGASYSNYAFGKNDLDREEITLTDEKSEDFKKNEPSGDATKSVDLPGAATNSFTSREKVSAQIKQGTKNGNNVATFSEPKSKKIMRSGSSKLGSYFTSQAILLLLLFKLV